MKSIPYMLQVVARLQTTCFMGDLTGTGVHPAESYVIHELWKESPLSQSEISARLEIGNATVGKTIHRLERNGFVERARVIDDRRRIMVKLTAKGEAAHIRLEKATSLLIADIQNILGQSGSEKFLASLNTLAEHFRECLPESQSGRGPRAAVQAQS
jgi:DNA-binding MarR family transcriptional regulator